MSGTTCTKSHVEHSIAVDGTGNEISYHRPFLRSALARSLYDRMMREEQLRKFDKKKWYKCDTERMESEIREKFVEMECDSETESFIEKCYSKSDWFLTHLFHSMARSVLSLFMTSTSINGFLDRGSMFVFSTDQFSKLYDKLPSIKARKERSNLLDLEVGDGREKSNLSDLETGDGREKSNLLDLGVGDGREKSNLLDLGVGDGREKSSLLDLGAGDGKVTQIMAQFFDTVHVTEVSPVMRRTLSKKGYTVVDTESWVTEETKYDLISCLNLLDRCEKPISILRSMVMKVKPGGRILIAIVLPLSQYVESGRRGTSDHRPSEILDVNGETFESQVVSFSTHVLAPNGLQIVKWTRLPYLCEGDLDLSFYWLHDFVMLVKRTGDD